MPRRRILGKKLFKSLLPLLFLLFLAVIAALSFILYRIVIPPRRSYLVTPQAFAQISGPVLRVTDESWQNFDNTAARGWLLRGAEGAPAVVLTHRYGADRSWLFNLGVKLYEATNFTILWPDLRGHGLNPTVVWTSFGTSEGDDVQAALDFLKSLKTSRGNKQVGDRMGLYGVELGAYASLRAAVQNKAVRVLVLDSVPESPDELVRAVVKDDLGLSNPPMQQLTRVAVRIYYLGRYKNTSTCELATTLQDRRILLLSGSDAGYLRDSTGALGRCLQGAANLEIKTDLPLTGLNLPSATGEQGEGYDRQVIDFFDKNLR